MKTNFIVRQALVAAVYAVMTLAIPALNYGPLQFRFSEVLTLLAFFNPEYICGITLGCFIANISSPFGIVDMLIGSFASFLAVYAMSKVKNIWIASIFPALSCILIGLEIVLFSSEPLNFFLITGEIMLSEIIIVTIIGVPLFKMLYRNPTLRRIFNFKKVC